MTIEIASGLALLGGGALLIFMGRPNKAGESPRFLRFSAAMMLYPPLILAFLVFGIALLIAAAI